MILGKSKEGADVVIDLPRLTETRLLLTANSGGGKSFGLRRLLEQTHGKIQQIVLDVEDEFHTLREKFDYVIAGSSNADCPAHTGCAAVLARRLLELNTSAIVSIYELKPQERKRFVRLFLDALVDADKKLWHNCLIVIDEADVFCPQVGDAESSDAVRNLMARGRKRGFCGILATQRISKLHKDAAAECNNKLIGRCALDLDMKRAGDELGLSGREQDQLRWLNAGDFFCFGPALSPVPKQIHIAPVQTSHPKAGQQASAPPPPREKVQKILAQLADLPRQAQEEAKTVTALQARVRELEKNKGTDPKEIDAAYKRGVNDGRIAGILLVEEKLKLHWGEFVRAHINELKNNSAPVVATINANKPINQVMAVVNRPRPVSKKSRDSDEQVSGGERRILVALAQHELGLPKDELALIAGFSLSGTFTTYLSNLRRAEFITGDSSRITITVAGLQALGSYDLLPTGNALFEYWVNWIGPGNGAAKILKTVREFYPGSITKENLAAASGFAESGTFTTYLSTLRKLGLISRGREIRLSDKLVDK